MILQGRLKKGVVHYTCKTKGGVKMFTILSLVLFTMVFGKLLVFAFKVGWGILKIAVYLVFLPVIVLMLIFGGLFYLALPIMLIAGIMGLAAKA